MLNKAINKRNSKVKDINFDSTWTEWAIECPYCHKKDDCEDGPPTTVTTEYKCLFCNKEFCVEVEYSWSSKSTALLHCEGCKKAKADVHELPYDDGPLKRGTWVCHHCRYILTKDKPQEVAS